MYGQPMLNISFVDILNSIRCCHDIFGEGGFGINIWATYVEYFFCWYIEFNQMVSWYIWWRRVWHKFWMGSTADVWSRRQFYSCPLPQSVSSSQCWKYQMQIYFIIFHRYLLKPMLKLAGKYFLLGLSCPNNFFISLSQHWEVHANAFKTTL